MNVEIADEKIGGLLEGRVARERPIIGQAFRLQHSNRLEEQRLAAHLYAHGPQVPVAFANVQLLDAECSVFLEMAQQTTKKFDFAGQVSVDLDQALLLGVHNQRSFHVMENLGGTGRGAKDGIRPESQGDEISRFALALEEKCIG